MAAIPSPAFTRVLALPRVLLWAASVGLLGTLLAILTLTLMNNLIPVLDSAAMDWIKSWELPGLSGFFEVVSLLTRAKAGIVYGPVGFGGLLLAGKTRAAMAFAIVGAVVAAVAILGDQTLGELVGRSRSAGDNPASSFPSGHIFGGTMMFGFAAFMAIHDRLNRRLALPFVIVAALLVLASGPSRIYLGDHWPSDVAAGYLLAGIWLLFLAPLYLRFGQREFRRGFLAERTPPFQDVPGTRIARSIARVVAIDPLGGTATKVYRPPLLVQLIYWIAFQARFPYGSNYMALQAALYRRRLAGLLTKHRFCKDLVAPVNEIRCVNCEYHLVTEFGPGDESANDDEAKEFPREVSQVFSDAGLSIWQVNPHNPHAHTNLIRTVEGDQKIIDLESALVTPFLAKGQLRHAFKTGNIPVFDDVDFSRLHSFLNTNAAALKASLGTRGLGDLRHMLGHLEQAIDTWKSSEPRVWSKLISGIYWCFSWTPRSKNVNNAVKGADRAAAAFLNRAIDRWERQRRSTSTESAALRSYLASGEVQDAIHHLGAHLVLSVAVAVPVPGLRSLARAGWTMSFWVQAQLKLLFEKGLSAGEKKNNIHTPLVAAIALMPLFGGAAYLLAKPLRKKILIRLIVDQMATGLPFRAYDRFRLQQWLAPPASRGPLDRTQPRR